MISKQRSGLLLAALGVFERVQLGPIAGYVGKDGPSVDGISGLWRRACIVTSFDVYENRLHIFLVFYDFR
jgi:hypothetical protein